MPAYLDEIQGEAKPKTLELSNGSTIDVQYHPDRISGRDLRRLMQIGQAIDAEKAKNPGQRIIGMLDACDNATRFILKVVDEWDLRFTRNGDIVPLEEDIISDFGIELLFDIMTQLMGAARLGEPKGKSSSTRSSRTRTNRSRSSSSRSAAASR